MAINEYTYRVIDVNLDLAIVSVEIDLPDGTIDEATFSTRTFCTDDHGTKNEMLKMLDGVIASYVFSTFPPPPPRPQSLPELLNVTRKVTL